MTTHRTHIARAIAPILAAATFAAAASGPLVPAHAAPVHSTARQAATTTYADPSRSYTLAYPSSWARTPRKNFDLFVRSDDGNVIVGSASAPTSDPHAGQLDRDLAGFVKSVGTPLGQPTYTSYRAHGGVLRVGMSGFTSAGGQVGVVVLEEARAKRRLCLVAGIVLNATAPTAKQDISAAVSVLTSLQTQPNVLDAPSG
jgi:hypothetical protein